ncbi:hypothetical protein BDV93DRAFT_607734 [Ceratobasidium sp. AG-I]|nr:hypothetical protein BDV93DRAFT_607734 [Ceratobasidium sp. AG-I]
MKLPIVSTGITLLAFVVGVTAFQWTQWPDLSAVDQSYTGQATVFNLGAGGCGITNSQSEYVVALGAPLWKDGANCGRNVTIEAYGKRVNATVFDECHACDNTRSIGLAPAAFQVFTNLDTKVINVTWQFT